MQPWPSTGSWGSVPTAHQRKVYRTLLLRQVHIAPLHYAVVGLDGASGHVVLVAHIPFDAGLSGGRMTGTLRQLIRSPAVCRRR